MTYQALARKWRPQDFSSIIGQDAVTTALRNAIADRRIAQAYLFSGIRGVGKTTAARVLAKALNCERRLRLEQEGAPPEPDPCNECGPCREITSGADLDVIEIDAATYSKVEQVRELTESLRYGPARDAYKVVVIDEIHRLSRQAFDALLKIVEEPPPHLVFIFATTEIEVVPATILSRCQEFHFRRVGAATLAAHLRLLCEAEGITASDRALRLVARAAEGSVRDAVALLDQLATFGSGTVAEGEAVRLLGGLDLQLFHHLLRSILAGEAAAVAAALARVEEEGWDPRRTHGQLLAYCRDALHAAVGVDPDRLDLPAEDTEQLVELARSAGYENLLRLLTQLLKSEELVRRSEAPALAVEIAWLRAAELPKLIRIEELLAGGSPAAAGRASTSTAATTRRGGDSAPAAPPGRAPRLSSDPKEALLELVGQRKQPLAARLRDCRDLRFEGGELAVVIPRGDTWLREALDRSQNREILDAAVGQIWGAGSRWRIVEELQAQATSAAPAPTSAPALAHPVVQSALDLFAGTIETIEETSVEDRGPEE
ncbi:MAG TPA: DNA polymerase III subunit gamma/tau [Thermoanaerobaculia bacterium]|nr:DNA polymerase III subunit gamma/tau [Thermoanaerobaculia bacterium]